jgi:AraC-like DNA-binding protein
VGRLERGPAPSPAVAWAFERLRATAGSAPVGDLAVELGWSRRHLAAMFREQVGLPPKSVARLLRFESVLRRIDADAVRWADIAQDFGYCDQSHLNRDFRDLLGTTPTEYLARRLPGGGLAAAGVTFVQDHAAASV